VQNLLRSRRLCRASWSGRAGFKGLTVKLLTTLRFTVVFVHVAIFLLTCLSLAAVVGVDWQRALRDDEVLLILLPTFGFNLGGVLLAILPFQKMRCYGLLVVEIAWVAFAVIVLSSDFIVFALLTLAFVICILYVGSTRALPRRQQ
jgi:hypothetical protein